MTGPTAVVVVTYGAPQLLDRYLGAITWPAETRVVVADNSPDPARGQIRDRCHAHGWQYLPMPGNIGFGAATNRGVAVARSAGCTRFLLLNPDAAPDPGVVEALAGEVDADPLAMVAPLLVGADGGPRMAWSTVRRRWGRAVPDRDPDPADPFRWLSGACLMVAAPLWDRLGGFDERFFLYWEDVDLGARCLDVGGRLVLREDLRVRHAAGGTHGQDVSGPGGDPADAPKSGLYLYWNCRNRLLFGAVHADRVGRAGLLRWLVATPRESYLLACRAGRRNLLRSRPLRRAAARGTADGVRIVLRELRRPGATGAAS